MAGSIAPSAEDARAGSQIDSGHSWYVLGLLTFAYALAYVDRQMLNLLVDPIKLSLNISDTQFSFVQGLAFVSAYLCAAPVFGRLVDIANRRSILIFGVCVWCLCTVLCGFADSYAKLFIARLGVGVSEACVIPVAMSMTGDLFSPKRAARAQSIFYIGVQVGGGVSLLAGGLIIAFASELRHYISGLAALETWQMAFVVIGLPGFLFALLLLSIREPQRLSSAADPSNASPMSMRQVSDELWAKKSFYGRIYLAIGMIAIIQLGMPSWFPSFLIRSQGVSAADTGLQLGAMSIIMGTSGTLLGPYLAGLLERRGIIDANLRVAAFSAVMMLIFCISIPLAPGRIGALIVAGGIYFSTGLPLGIIAAATQIATPSRMRGVVFSFYTFTAQVVGYMIGPTLIAFCTDKVFGDPKMVGHSMQLVMSIAAAMATLLLLSNLVHYRKILAGSLQQTQRGATDSINSV